MKKHVIDANKVMVNKASTEHQVRYIYVYL